MVPQPPATGGKIGVLQPFLVPGHLKDQHQQGGDVRNGDGRPHLLLGELDVLVNERTSISDGSGGKSRHSATSFGSDGSVVTTRGYQREY
ncbi:hypothetical protein ACFFX0_30670 [Citricoccus parietis]|uniref:Uncharacterized protein n=1 Tax=Citricoccus parietis TaxID=592307 RepID=A0ABV5G8P0_9MICC